MLKFVPFESLCGQALGTAAPTMSHSDNFFQKMGENSKRLETPKKSPVDPKQYRALTLKNGLKVLIIQDHVQEGDFL